MIPLTEQTTLKTPKSWVTGHRVLGGVTLVCSYQPVGWNKRPMFKLVDGTMNDDGPTVLGRSSDSPLWRGKETEGDGQRPYPWGVVVFVVGHYVWTSLSFCRYEFLTLYHFWVYPIGDVNNSRQRILCKGLFLFTHHYDLLFPPTIENLLVNLTTVRFSSFPGLFYTVAH